MNKIIRTLFIVISAILMDYYLNTLNVNFNVISMIAILLFLIFITIVYKAISRLKNLHKNIKYEDGMDANLLIKSMVLNIVSTKLEEDFVLNVYDGLVLSLIFFVIGLIFNYSSTICCSIITSIFFIILALEKVQSFNKEKKMLERKDCRVDFKINGESFSGEELFEIVDEYFKEIEDVLDDENK